MTRLAILGRCAAVALLASAAIHAFAAPPHLQENARHGAFFVALSAAQLILGAWLLLHPARPVLVTAAGVCAATVALWTVSRTTGLPGSASEAVGYADLVATLLELVVVGVAVVDVASRAERGVTHRSGVAVTSIAALLVAVVALPALADARGHQHGDHGHGDAHEPGHDNPGGDDAAMETHHEAHEGADHQTTDSHNEAHGDGDEPFVFEEHDHDAVEPCDPAPEDQAAADALLAEMKSSIVNFADPEVAEDLGFRRFGDGDIAGTWHYINWRWQADDIVLDPERPESIIYWQSGPDAPMIPIGAMFIMPTAGETGPQVGGCLTRWHVHGAPFATEGELTTEMLHVWTIPMPDGPFV